MDRLRVVFFGSPEFAVPSLEAVTTATTWWRWSPSRTAPPAGASS